MDYPDHQAPDYKALVEKYWMGETTLEEERLLKAFFAREDAETDETGLLFSLWREEAALGCPHLERPWQRPAGRPIRFRRYWEYAALVAVVAASFWLAGPAQRPAPAPVASRVIDDPHQAWETTRKALEILAAGLHRGQDGVERLSVLHDAEQAITQEK